MLEDFDVLLPFKIVLQLIVEPPVMHLLYCLMAVCTDCNDILSVVTATVVLRNDVVSLKYLLVVFTTDKATIHLSTEPFL